MSENIIFDIVKSPWFLPINKDSIGLLIKKLIYKFNSLPNNLDKFVNFICNLLKFISVNIEFFILSDKNICKFFANPKISSTLESKQNELNVFPCIYSISNWYKLFDLLKLWGVGVEKLLLSSNLDCFKYWEYNLSLYSISLDIFLKIIPFASK